MNCVTPKAVNSHGTHPASSRKFTQKLIRQAISDLASDNLTLKIDSEKYFHGHEFLIHMGRAGYPPELLDTLRDVMARSGVQRKYLVKKTLDALKEEWDEN